MENSSGKPIDIWLACIGIAMGIAFYWIPKNPFTVIASLILIFALLIHPIWNFWWIEEKYYRRILVSLFFVTCLSLFGYSVWPDQHKALDTKATAFNIYEPFQEIYKAELGSPLGKVRENNQIYLAAHDHALVIWVHDLSEFFVLDNTNGTFKWKKHSDAHWDPDPKWKDDKFLRKRFHTPIDKKPPYSGVAKQWDLNNELWEWIGWRVWHCNLKGVYLQEFQNGIIIGGLVRTTTSKEAVVYTLVNDDKWHSLSSKTLNTPICKPLP